MSSSTRRPRRVPVTALLMVLILALAAPSLAFSALLLLQSDRVTRSELSIRATQGVERIAETLNRELHSMATLLSVLAASGWVESEQYDRLHARASQALAGTDTFLIVIDAQFKQMLNTRVPWGTPLNAMSDPASAQRAMDTGAATVSDRFFGQVARIDVFNVAIPIEPGDLEAKALILTRDADALDTIFQNSTPPVGWTVAILDASNNRVTGRAPAGGDDVLLGRLCVADSDSPHQIEQGRVRYSAASKKLTDWGWRACLWTSSDQAEATISQRWRTFTIVVLIVVGVTLLSAAWLGRMLADSIRRAATVGRALDAGGDVPEQRSVVREVDEVLGTLTRAARRRLQQQEELQILLKETAHRAKNQIAISSALVRLSARSAESVEQLRDDISARLSALGRSIDMMAGNPTGSVSLKQLVTVQLEPFAAGASGRLSLAGADVLIEPAMAQSLGLVLHEKATNASKYGSWSVADGRVKVEWRETGDGLTVVWTELGGPTPSAPTRTGFGTSLIEVLIERNLGGTVERDYRASGLVATFRIPKSRPQG